MNRRGYVLMFLVVVLALALVGCSSGGAQAQPGAAPAATTDQSGSGGSGGSGGSAGASGDQVVVTADMAGKTVNMKVGQQLLVKLGTEGNCKADVTPTFLLNSVDGAKLNPGEQGLFEAKMNGSATVQATCDSSKQYNITVTIAAAQ